ncbi:hypothetical protein MRX96_027684 [Rhipicephalus microplus]
MGTPLKHARLRPCVVASIFVNEQSASEAPRAAFLKSAEDEDDLKQNRYMEQHQVCAPQNVSTNITREHIPGATGAIANGTNYLENPMSKDQGLEGALSTF